MIEHVVHHLAGYGIDEVVLSLGFAPEAFREAYPDGSCLGVRLIYAVEPEPLDTAGAIRFAAAEAGIEETFLVVNGDVLSDVDVAALVAFHRRRGAEGTLHLHSMDDPSMFGVVVTGDDGAVSTFVEKPPRERAPSHSINAGTYVLEPSVLDRIATERKVSIEREVFPAMAADRSLFALELPGYWLDTGRPDQYLRANLDALAQVRRNPLPCPALAAGAEVRGSVERSLVGPGARVEAGARVVDSVLMVGVVVGAGSSVRSSVLGPGAVVGTGATLVDSVIGGGTAVPDGAVLEDRRVPEPER
jgi:mannose-1-phosphate guanylyltransferase